MPIATLLALGIIISFLKLNYYDWPPNRDVNFYAVVSHEILQGKRLYSDVWDIKPPGVFITYGAAEAIFGYSSLAIFLLNLVCALIILVGVYKAGCASGFGPMAGMWAALFWVALTGDISLQLHDANTEAFMNACLIWAFVFFLVPEKLQFNNKHAFLIGVLFAWASLYKHAIIVVPIALSIAHIALPPELSSRRQAVIHVFIIAAIGAATWSGLAVYMFFTDRFQIFYDTIFTQASAYVGSPTANIAGAVSSSKLIEALRRFKVVIPLLIFTSVGVMFGLLKERSRAWILIFVYAAGAFLSILLPGKFYRHYFQLGIPPLVVAGGWAIVTLSRKASKVRINIVHISAAFALLYIVAHQIPYYSSQPEQLLQGKYAELYLVTQKLGRKLSLMLKPDETFFQWGNESGLYFFSQHRPPGSTINGWSLFSQTFGKQFSERALNELEMAPPDYVIIARYFLEIMPNHPVQQMINKNYCPAEGLSEQEDKYFILMERCVNPRLKGSTS